MILITLLVIALVNYSSVNVEVYDEIPPIKKEPGIKIIGLISDTHIPSRSKKLPENVFVLFEDVDMIIHAGDIVRMDVVKSLEKIAPVIAVYGNMDPDSLRTALDEIEMVEIYNLKIGVMHNPNTMWGIGGMKKIAKENDLDVLIFGHTHKQFMKWEDDILFINPGSPTDPLPPIFVKSSVGLLLVSEDRVQPFFIKV